MDLAHVLDHEVVRGIDQRPGQGRCGDTLCAETCEVFRFSRSSSDWKNHAGTIRASSVHGSSRT